LAVILFLLEALKADNQKKKENGRHIEKNYYINVLMGLLGRKLAYRIDAIDDRGRWS